MGGSNGTALFLGAILTPRGPAGRGGLVKGGGHIGLLTSLLAPDPAWLQGGVGGGRDAGEAGPWRLRCRRKCRTHGVDTHALTSAGERSCEP